MVNMLSPALHVPPVNAGKEFKTTAPAVVFMASLKVITMLPLRAAPVPVGATDNTVGGVVSGVSPVVKLWLPSVTIVLPATSLKPEMFTVYAVL